MYKQNTYHHLFILIWKNIAISSAIILNSGRSLKTIDSNRWHHHTVEEILKLQLYVEQFVFRSSKQSSVLSIKSTTAANIKLQEYVTTQQYDSTLVRALKFFTLFYVSHCFGLALFSVKDMRRNNKITQTIKKIFFCSA